MMTRSYLHTPWNGSVPYNTIPERLIELAERHPNKEAFVFVGENSRTAVTYSGIVENAGVYARKFIVAGILKGDVVAIHDDKSPTWLYCTYGAMMCGARPPHFYFEKRDGSDIADVLKRVNCKALITQPGDDDVFVSIVKHFATFKEGGNVFSQEVPSLRLVIFSQTPRNFKVALTVDDILQRADDPLQVIEPEDVAAILFSSGSSGAPKFIPWTHSNLLLISLQVSNVIGYTNNDILFCDKTFGWIAGYPIEILNGIKRVTNSSSFKEKSLTEICETTVRIINQENCVQAILFSSTINELLRTCPNLNKMKTIITGGAPIPGKESEVVRTVCQRFINFYGSTEFYGLTLNVITENDKLKNYDCGIPLPGVEVKVMADDGKLAEIGTIGEIYARSISGTFGFIDAEQDWHKEARTKGYWYKTGDAGYISGDGHLFVTGRIEESITVEDEILSPSFYEDVFKKHPCAQNVVAFAIPDDVLHEVAGIAITLKDGQTTTVEELLMFYKNEMDLYYDSSFFGTKLTPRRILFFDSFKRTNSGKIARKVVKQDALRIISSS
ncbi:hypothetical protein FSP39_023149 [Pinctada imbricata]|uniref:AMP-dependent synthetase/ligase domain-containing protein n=1 Tax=Pinctada imbricata TaxID=66713 RepID=A0AA88YJU8_PINIB|nr:hypothetical protein FSP39_023149 [Pinctada imbricata]